MIDQAMWKGWSKNIAYDTIPADKTKRQEAFARHFSASRDWTRPWTDTDMVALYLAYHIDQGVNYVVQKRVSDDLGASSIGNVNMEDIAWPCNSLEVFFEDPALPTVVLQRLDPPTRKEIFLLSGRPWKDGVLGQSKNVRFSVIMACTEKGVTLLSLLSLAEEDCNEWLKGDLQLRSERADCAPKDWDRETSDLAVRTATALALKVLIYAGVPQLAPKQVGKNTLHHGGKPGVKGRPNRPIFHVVDLPRQYREKMDAATRGKSKAFRGKHGHFHHYRDDYFVNKKGTFEYWPPVLGPDGTLPKIKYRVRKL